jgi:hypothetical protein
MRGNITLLLLLAHLVAIAQNKIETDRPDQTENTFVMRPRDLQFETGFILDRFNHTNEYIGHGLVRYGVVKNVELRLLIEEGKNRDAY